jgi:hypothetical protein
MGRSHQSESEHRASVPAGRLESCRAVLRTHTRKRRESAGDAAARRAVPANSVLRDPADDGLARAAGVSGQPQAGGPAAAGDGLGSYLSETEAVATRAGTQDLPVSAARSGRHSTQPGMVDGYYLCAAAPWICLSGSGHGLVQPIRAGLGGVRNDGFELLCDGPRVGPAGADARDLQLRPRISVYQPGVYATAASTRSPDQHGWPRTCDGQHLRGAAMAQRQVRGSVSEGLQKRAGGHCQPGKIFPVLQSGKAPSIAGLSNAWRGLPWLTAKPTKQRSVEMPPPWKSPAGIPTEAWKNLRFSHIPTAPAARRHYLIEPTFLS